MSTTWKARIKRFLKFSTVGSAAALVLVIATAGVLDAFFGTDVLFISPKSPDVVELERTMWEPGDPVADIYGVPAGQQARVVFADAERIIRPAEDDRLILMAVDKQRGDNPLQIKTVWFIATRAAMGFGVATVLCFGAFYLARRRWA